MEDYAPVAGVSQGMVLMLVPVLAMLGAILMAPMLPTIQAHFNAVPHAGVLVPLMLTAPALCIALLSPLVGVASDRFGCRRVLVWSLALYGFAGTAPMYLQTLTMIFASRLLVGVAEAGALISSMTLMAHYFSGDQRQKWFAYQNATLPLIGAGLLLATGRIGNLNWRATFAIYGVGTLLWLAAVVVLPEVRVRLTPAAPAAPRTSRFPPWAALWPIVTIAVPGSIAFYAGPIELAYLLQRLGYSAPSVSANATAVALLLGPFGALVSRAMTHLPVGRVLTVAMFAMGIGLAIMASARGVPLMTVGLVLQQMGGGLMATTGSTYAVSLARPAERGIFSGAWWFFYMVAQFVAPLLLSALLTVTGDRSLTVLAAGGVAVTSCLWLLSWGRFRRLVVPTSPLTLGST